MQSLPRLLAEIPTASVILRLIADQAVPAHETTVNWVAEMLTEQRLSVQRNDIINTMKGLATLRYGAYTNGRHGKLSRFRWMMDARVELTKAISSVAGASHQSLPPSPPSSQRVDMQTVRFPLRADLQIDLIVPKNITDNEARRLSRFILTLPFAQ